MNLDPFEVEAVMKRISVASPYVQPTGHRGWRHDTSVSRTLISGGRFLSKHIYIIDIYICMVIREVEIKLERRVCLCV